MFLSADTVIIETVHVTFLCLIKFQKPLRSCLRKHNLKSDLLKGAY